MVGINLEVLISVYRNLEVFGRLQHQSLKYCGTENMKQFPWVHHWLLVTSHLQEIPQDLFIQFYFLEHELTV